MMLTDEMPRVWIGCLGCYNNGDLVGKWYDADEIPEREDWLTDNLSPEAAARALSGADLYDIHEELWVFDHEGWDGVLSGEFSPMDAQAAWSVLENLHGDERGAFGAYVEHYGYRDLEDALIDFQDHFCGLWHSREDYAQDLAESIGALEAEMSWPHSYIDWERAARDLFMDYTDVECPTGGIYVFSN